MEHKGYYLLGTIVRTHGVKGHLILKLDVDDPSLYRKIEAIWLEQSGTLRPFHLNAASLSGEFLNVGLEGIDDKTAADQLVRSQVYLPLSSLPKLKGKRIYLHELNGMMVVDSRIGEIGRVDRIYDLPEQPVASVQYKGKEVLFPLVTKFIDRTDKEGRVLYVTLPEGLVEVYL